MFPIAVQEGQIGLLEVVRALGDYLTSTEDEVRVRGREYASTNEVVSTAYVSPLIRNHLVIKCSGQGPGSSDKPSGQYVLAFARLIKTSGTN